MPKWFELDSTAVLVVCAVICTIVLLITVFWVPRRRPSKTWKAVIQQAISLLLAIILSLATIFLTLNRLNDWYPSWSSISGKITVNQANNYGDAQSNQPVTASDWVVGQATSLQQNPIQNPALNPDQDPDLFDADQGTMLSVNIPATNPTDFDTSALVWLPPSYLNNPDRFYPVVIAFSGVPGTINAYKSSLPIGEMINDLVDEHKLRESIVMIPNAYPENVDTECVDSSDGSVKMETYLTQDVPNWIRENLRVVDKPDAWATLGYSAGGWCSTMISMRHPTRVKYSINLSGYFSPTFDGKKLLDSGDNRYDLSAIASNLAPDVKIWFWAAKDDALPMNSLKTFQPKIIKPTSLTTTLLDSGGHTSKVWKPGAQAGLEWLGSQSSEFAWVAS